MKLFSNSLRFDFLLLLAGEFSFVLDLLLIFTNCLFPRLFLLTTIRWEHFFSTLVNNGKFVYLSNFIDDVSSSSPSININNSLFSNPVYIKASSFLFQLCWIPTTEIIILFIISIFCPLLELGNGPRIFLFRHTFIFLLIFFFIISPLVVIKYYLFNRFYIAIQLRRFLQFLSNKFLSQIQQSSSIITFLTQSLRLMSLLVDIDVYSLSKYCKQFTFLIYCLLWWNYIIVFILGFSWFFVFSTVSDDIF